MYKFEKRFDLDILKKNNIAYSWDTIVVGLIFGMLNVEAICQYAVEYLENNPECSLVSVVELAWNITPANEMRLLDAEKLLKQVFFDLNISEMQKDESRWNLECRKWRYCILKLVESRSKNDEELIYEIETAWVDFFYPDDMYDCVDCFSIDVPNFPQEKKIKLIDGFNVFLKTEKVKIDQEDTTVLFDDLFDELYSDCQIQKYWER